jgi:glutathione peroxidase
MAMLHDFTMQDIDGNPQALADYKGKVVLVVNVASKCGLTPQYDGLKRLYYEFRQDGFEVLGFPCNQFMGQEPGSESEIKEFCTVNFGIDFPLFSKLEVNGDGRAPLYAWLCGTETGPAEGGEIKWNFEKFLVGKDGDVLARFSPQIEPCAQDVKDAVKRALA